ncbi:MAG: ABC transporter ATP-binding protein [Candidatus Methanoplasma sp.]|nr:ABC transporter ATP-binding protein [Candidatus Methanoplasma sp.]
MNPTDPIIIAENLTKKYGDLTAVDDLSISVMKGEIFGFLGPNGAGKTTTIKMLTTMTMPASGRITIAGYDSVGEYRDARRNIGVIQQHNSLDKDISVRENIIHHALMQNMPRPAIGNRVQELSEIMNLGDRLDTPVEKLSGGWKKRVAIVCSIVHDPPILFMDEPTTGLDTQSRNALWVLIRKLNRNGTTIFLTTHYISEAEALCDRIGVINKGRIIAIGSSDELRSRIGTAAVERLNDDGTSDNRYFGNRTEAKSYMQSLPEDSNVSIRRTNLEDVFLEFTGRKL